MTIQDQPGNRRFRGSFFCCILCTFADSKSMKDAKDTLVSNIFQSSRFSSGLALDVFQYQYHHCQVYQQWCNAIGKDPGQVKTILDIPFLPISFFKTQSITDGAFTPELIFESSGTTTTVNSRHLVRYESIYQRSFIQAFELFYGQPKDYCILGLLPNYLEKGHSSLVKMVHDLIGLSGHPDSGFYLYDFNQLGRLILDLERKGQKTLLLGVTFALMDFAEDFALLKQASHCNNRLQNTVIMDTGGMKGRKKEMTRDQVHHFLTTRLGVDTIHSEYGMTELLSQAYSQGEGKYRTPPWMQVLVRDQNDPLEVKHTGKGLLNVIDLANIHSCSFIATDDVGRINTDNFEIWGRLDHSDLRGCSLLVPET